MDTKGKPDGNRCYFLWHANNAFLDIKFSYMWFELYKGYLFLLYSHEWLSSHVP